MKLIAVYNAHSGVLHQLLDAGHKLISPRSYSCSLCQLTHGTFKEHKLWADLKASSSIPVESCHKDEFERRFGKSEVNYPVVLIKSGDRLSVILSSEAIDKIRTLEELIKKLEQLINDETNRHR